MQRNSGNENFFSPKSIKALVFGVIGGVITIALMLIIIGFSISKMNSYPQQLISYIVLGMLAVGGFNSGYITGRIYTSSGLLYGIISGVVIFILIFISGSSSIAEGVSIFTLYKLIILIVTSALGGILGVNKKDKIHIK